MLKIVIVLSLYPLQTSAQSTGGVIIPFDPLRLLPKTGTTAQDTVQKRTIEIIHSDYLEQETDTFSNTVKRKLKDRVKLLHDGAFMVCDSAILFPQTNYLEAHGSVKITKGDSVDVRSEILKYNGDTKIAILERNVRLKDKSSVLTAPMMTYEVDNETGHFWDGGTLISDSTTLTSKSGTHFQKAGYAVFRGDVVLVSPDYTMYADSMKYYTETKIAYFITKTTIISGSDTIVTDDGYFDTQKNKAVLKGRPLIKNGQDNTLQSNHLDYDKATGIGIATGNVVSRNIKENATLLANHVYYIDSIKYTRATQDPLMIKEDEKDTLYLSADTLINYTIPLSEFLATDSTDSLSADSLVMDSLAVKDSIALTDSTKLISADSITTATSDSDTITAQQIKEIIVEIQGDSISDVIARDTVIHRDGMSTYQQDSIVLDKDSTLFLTDSSGTFIQDSIGIDSAKSDSVKVFFGYRNVKLIRTNLSGICDSIYFNSQDSIFKLYYNPILWMDSTQLKSDSIYIFMKNEEAERIELYQNAIIINESDPGVFNQISGKKITGWLHENKLRHVLVDGNAECIYFLKNDSSEYIGGNHAKSALINITFNEESEIQRIKLEISPEAVFTPIQQVEYNSYRLPNFDWYWSLKPKTKWDVIRDTVQYQKFLLDHPLPVDSTQMTEADSMNVVSDSLDTQDPDSTVTEPEPDLSIEKSEQENPSIIRPDQSEGILPEKKLKKRLKSAAE